MDDSESSDEMDSVRENCSAKYFNKPAKDTQVIHTNVNNSSKLLKNPLGSSTPVSDSKNSVSGINLIRTKQLKQLHKHLAKNVADKQKLVDFVKSHENFEKDNYSSSSDIFKSSYNNVKSKLSDVSNNNTDSSDEENNLNSCSNLQSDSGISNDEHRQLKSPLQNPLLSKSDVSLLSTKSVSLNSLSPNKIKSGTSLTNQNVVLGSNTDHNSKKNEDNSVYTQYIVNSDNQNFTQSIHNSASSEKDMLNKSKSPIESKINALRLSTRSIKQKDSPWNVGFKIRGRKNENDMVKLQSGTIFSMLSDVDSSSNEHIELSVPHTIQEVDFNKEIENNTINNLPAPKNSITTAQCTSSSDDEVYTKLKLNLSKMENPKPSIEKTDYQNSHSVYSSDNESDLSSVCDTSSLLSSKVTKLNASPNKCINILSSDNCHLNNYNVPPNKVSEDTRKKLNEKSVLHESSMYSDNKSKLFPNLNNNENNSNKMMKQILKESSNSDELMNQKVSNIIPTSSISKSERFVKPIISKKFSNPFLKVNSTNSTSSSEDEAFVTDLTIKHSSKKKSTPLDTKNVKKNTLIQKLITSIKDEDQLSKQKWIAQDIDSSSSEESKLAEVFTSNESGKKTKNKISILKNPIEESNLSNVNISQESNLLQLQIISSSSSSSTEDEIDLIKTILEKRKKNKSYKQKSAIKNNSANLSKSTKSFKKLKSPMKMPEETKNLVLDIFNKESKTSEKIHKKAKSHQKPPSVKTNELFNSINTKNEKPMKSKDLLIEYMLNNIDDSYSTKVNKNLTQSNILSNTSEKKSKKFTLQNASLDTTDESIKNNTIKKKKKKSKETKNLLVDTIINFLGNSSDTAKNNFPSQQNELSKISEKKNEKSEPLKPSMIITDKSSKKNHKKKKSKETKDLLLDNRIDSSIDNFSSTIDSNYLTQLNKMTKTLDKKNKKSSSAKTVVLTDELVNDTMKKKKKKPKVSENLFLDSTINSIAGTSSTMKHNSKKSRESKDSTIEFSNNDTPSKKKKTDHYSTTDNTNKLQTKSPVRGLPELCKKKKTELQYDTKCSTIKDNKKKYNLPIECLTNDKNMFTDKKEKKKKKVKMLLNDPTQHDTQSTSIKKILKTELDTSMKNHKKTESINKKKKASRNELKVFLSTQESPLINNLDSLYSSLQF